MSEPIPPPKSIPQYIPNSPILNVNPKRYANIKTRMNSLNDVKTNDIVPFPTP